VAWFPAYQLSSKNYQPKKTPSLPQNGNEGIRRVLAKTDRQAGPILLFAEKCLETFEADERSPTGILTWASNLFPPSRPTGSGIGNCSRHSGATVSDSHGVPRHLTALMTEIVPSVSKNDLVWR